MSIGLLINQRGMPQGLSEGERIAYRSGWDRAALKFAKDNGLPRERVTSGVDLREASRLYYEEREPVAHKAGMSALTRHQKLRGLTSAPAPRRARALSHCPHCGGDLKVAS